MENITIPIKHEGPEVNSGNPSILTQIFSIPNAEQFEEIAPLIVTPPQRRDQHQLVAPRRMLKQIKKLDPHSPTDRQILNHIVTGLPRVTGIHTSSITLSPVIQDDRLMVALYDLCGYYIQLLRDGYYVVPGSVTDLLYPELRLDYRFWCGLGIRNHATATSISITRSTQHEQDRSGHPLYTNEEANRLRDSCVNDCAVLVQNFLDDLHQTALDQITFRQPTEGIPFPELRSVEAHRIVFDSFGPKSNRLYRSGIQVMLNRAKNVYTRGESEGLKAYRRKRRLGQPVMNSWLRMEVVFTTRINRQNQLIVDFLFDPSHKPFFIIPRSHNQRRVMTKEEAEACRLSFAQFCATVLQNYFEQIRSEAVLLGVTPDYLQPIVEPYPEKKSAVSITSPTT